MAITMLILVIIMGCLFIKDGFIIPIKLKKQGKSPPPNQLILVIIEIAFLSFFLVMFAKLL